MRRRKAAQRRLVIRGVAFDPSQLRALDAVAIRERRSRSFLVREALAEVLPKWATPEGQPLVRPVG